MTHLRTLVAASYTAILSLLSILMAMPPTTFEMLFEMWGTRLCLWISRIRARMRAYPHVWTGYSVLIPENPSESEADNKWICNYHLQHSLVRLPFKGRTNLVKLVKLPYVDTLLEELSNPVDGALPIYGWWHSTQEITDAQGRQEMETPEAIAGQGLA